MTTLLQFLFSGITVGATYASAALGFALICNASNVINLAQGEFIMLGSMLALFFMQSGSPLLVQEIFNAILSLREQGKTVFPVEQNAQAELSIGDQAYVIETGETVLSGTGTEFLVSERMQSAYVGIWSDLVFLVACRKCSLESPGDNCCY